MHPQSVHQARNDAMAIWRAGVNAVDSRRLVAQAVRLEETCLRVCQQVIPLAGLGRVLVVGAGKAGTGMAQGLEEALPPEFLDQRVSGWINVPADCLPEIPLRRIYLHPARPAGINEPTEAGYRGTLKILELVADMRPEDVCLVLISGGGSALLPAPAAGISLEDKLQITRRLSKAGATIDDLNRVRRALSLIKGGGLLRACPAGSVFSLVISDVVGDPLETIASGPTVPLPVDRPLALSLLHDYLGAEIPRSVQEFLARPETEAPPLRCLYHNDIIGSNAVALRAAGNRAEELGYRVLSLGSEVTELAAELRQQLVRQGLEYPLIGDGQPLCLLCGGETTVPLADVANPGKGGRNQEVAVAALATLEELPDTSFERRNLTLLAAGTDGEDGPTNAAGGFADRLALKSIRHQNLNTSAFLREHNSHALLKACDSLFITGPTHTNVMDLNVVLIHPHGHAVQTD